MSAEPLCPWKQDVPAGDKIGSERTYDSYAQLDRFEERKFVTGDERIGDITYYVYDPTKHGYPADREYPMLYAFHGAHGGMQGRVAIDWAAAAMFASDAYQEQIGGMYIVCPLANESLNAEGELQMSWMTPKAAGDLSIYSEKVLKEIAPILEENPRMQRMLGTDTIYADALFDLLHKEKEAAGCISKVILFGVSAGGYCAWRLLIDRPEEFTLALPMCGAYLPAECEIRKIEKAGTKVMISNAKHDELVNYYLTVKPNLDLYAEIPTFEVYDPDFARNGAHEIIYLVGLSGVQQGQHCINNCIQQNMIYDDGTLYDERWPEGITGLIKSVL